MSFTIFQSGSPFKTLIFKDEKDFESVGSFCYKSDYRKTSIKVEIPLNTGDRELKPGKSISDFPLHNPGKMLLIYQPANCEFIKATMNSIMAVE